MRMKKSDVVKNDVIEVTRCFKTCIQHWTSCIVIWYCL